MTSWDEKDNDYVPMQKIIDNVKKMAYDSKATKIAKSQSLSINTVSFEDCARNKFSVWGPCISDMTLQVNNQRMPVIREPNYTDTTWDVQTDKVPLVVGNQDSNPGAQLKTVSLREYLENFNDYMSTPPKKQEKINLIANDLFAKQTDKHVIMSSQCCFLPIEKGKETKFNVALFNYQSKQKDPAVLVIVSTSKGTSAQIIEGNEQKLLFNNNGRKADFIGQRLTDNRIERNVPIHGPMTKQEKQDNCIVIIQIPLKQKPKTVHVNHTQYQYNYIPQISNPYNPQQPFPPQYPSIYYNQPQPQPMMYYNNQMGTANMGTANMGTANMGSGGYGGYAQQQQQQQQQVQQQCASTAFMNVNMNNNMNMNMNNNNNNNNMDDLFGMSEGSNMAQNNVQIESADFDCFGDFDSADIPKQKSMKKKDKKDKKKKKKPAADVEAAIVKIAPKTVPICSCGGNLEEVELRTCYSSNQGGVSCDGCSKSIKGMYSKLWHCPLEKTTFKHKDGYDLCMKCGEKQLQFEELNGMNMIERDTRYPIRVTLQYYKSTDNGILDMDIMKAIKDLLIKSQKQADYIGSLVTDYTMRSTEPDLITKNKTKVIHHVNTVNVNVPIAVPGVVTIVNQTQIIKDPFEEIVDDMKHKVNHGKYNKIAQALKELNVKDSDKYLENFKNEQVTDNDLRNLCRDDLLELIPKMGPRNRFLKWLQSEYPNNNNNTDTNFMSGFL